MSGRAVQCWAPRYQVLTLKASYFDEEPDVIKQYGGRPKGRPQRARWGEGCLQGLDEVYQTEQRRRACWVEESVWGQPGEVAGGAQLPVGGGSVRKMSLGSRSHGRLWSWRRAGSDLRPVDWKVDLSRTPRKEDRPT